MLKSKPLKKNFATCRYISHPKSSNLSFITKPCSYKQTFAFYSNCPTFSLTLFYTSDLLHLFSFIQFYRCLSPFPLSVSPPPSIPPSPSYPPSLPSHPSLALLTSPLPPCFSLLPLPQFFHPFIHPSIHSFISPSHQLYLPEAL